jgi:hypothetical protein
MTPGAASGAGRRQWGRTVSAYSWRRRQRSVQARSQLLPDRGGTATARHKHWLPRARAAGIPLPANDFWAIDDRVVMVRHVSGDGDFVTEEVSSDPDLVKLCTSACEQVWERGIDHDDYRPASPTARIVPPPPAASSVEQGPDRA